MNHIEITSLPDILFSHIYKPNSYRADFPIRENLLEICYIADGSLALEVGSDKFHAKKGDVICFLYHAKASVFTDKFHCHHTVGARVGWKFSSDEQSLLLPTITPDENNTSSICLLIDDFVHNRMTYKTAKALGAAKFLDLLCAIDKCNRKMQKKDLPSELLYAERAKKYINQNISTCITQKSVAEHLGISSGYLCSLFKQAEGTTMMKYINKLKLENVKTLMNSKNIPLYEAAALYGYTDANYVSRLYKQLFGYNITDKPRMHPSSNQ